MENNIKYIFKENISTLLFHAIVECGILIVGKRTKTCWSTLCHLPIVQSLFQGDTSLHFIHPFNFS